MIVVKVDGKMVKTWSYKDEANKKHLKDLLSELSLIEDESEKALLFGHDLIRYKTGSNGLVYLTMGELQGAIESFVYGYRSRENRDVFQSFFG